MDLKQILKAAKAHLEKLGYDFKHADKNIIKSNIFHFTAGANFVLNEHNQDKETIQELVKALKEISQIVNPSLIDSVLDMKKIADEALLKVKS